MCSEVDAGLHDDDYDVDDYESDSVDDVIDISSGTEDTADPPIISKITEASTSKLSLPPCNTLGRKDYTTEVTDMKNANPIDESKCSDVSFLTASENSMKNLTATSTFDQAISSLDPEAKEVFTGEQVKISDFEVMTPVESDLDNAVEQTEKYIPSADFIGVVDVSQYDVSELNQNHQVTITYELQEKMLTSTEMNEEGMEYTVEYATNNDFVSSELNNALLHADSVGIIEEPSLQTPLIVSSTDSAKGVSNLRQGVENVTEGGENLTEGGENLTESGENFTEGGENLNNAVIASQDTILPVTDSIFEMTQQVITTKDITTSDATLIDTKNDNELVSAEDAQFISTTCDLNAGAIVDTITFQDSLTTSQNLLLVDSYDQHVTESVSGNLNEAILCNQSEDGFIEPEITGLTTDTTNKIIDDAHNQQTDDNEEIVLDIDEILESAVVPDVQKNNDEKVEPSDANVQSQNPPTSDDTLIKSIVEDENKIQKIPRKRLRSNSDAAVPTPPTIMTRKRSGSFTPAKNTTTVLQSESTSNDSITSPAPRMTRAKSEAKILSIDESVSRTPRSTRAKSEIKTTTSDSIDSTAESIDVIPKKVKRTATRNINSPANTPDADTVRRSTRVTRSRTRSIAEDDDTASIVSEISLISGRSEKSTRSTRNTRAKSLVTADDNDDSNESKATTTKKSRTKAKILPVISEDVSQEGEAESQPYADTRR